MNAAERVRAILAKTVPSMLTQVKKASGSSNRVSPVMERRYNNRISVVKSRLMNNESGHVMNRSHSCN